MGAHPYACIDVVSMCSALCAAALQLAVGVSQLSCGMCVCGYWIDVSLCRCGSMSVC